MKQQHTYMRLFFAAVIAIIVAACASMGRPEGGPIDETPPVFIKSTPTVGATNVTADRYTIMFDENVQIKDAMNKVVVSPPQKSIPKVSAVGHYVRVEMVDTLLPNTTYTIDFSDAISDLNEGNELDGFAIDFSTGDTLDSLCIAGMVFEAETLEPAQGMLVGAHSNLSDTAIKILPFDRITKTNQLGQFILRNLKPGKYHIFALNDINRDYMWDRTEDIAFYDAVISPSSERINVNDTLLAADGSDSIIVTQATHFMPDDVLLTWFNERYKAQYLAKYERKERNRIYFEFGAKSDSLPELRFIGGPRDGQLIDECSVLDASPTRDTLTYWFTDTLIVNTDSITMQARYLRTDTLDQLSWTTDTLKFNMRKAKSKKKKDKEKDKEKDKKIELGADSTASDSTATQAPKIDFLKFNSNASGSIDVYAPLLLNFEQPLSRFNDSAVHLEMQVDTLWNTLKAPKFSKIDSLRPLTYRADIKWEPGAKYRLTIDSLGVENIYGKWCAPTTFEFTVKSLSEYGNISFSIANLGSTPAIAQLLNSQDKPVHTVKVTGSVATFMHVTPGDYFARLFIDRNENGIWDTGNLTDSIQPEETFYYNRKIALKKNWDIQQSWDLIETPVDMQKPMEIKKNKPKKKRGETDSRNSTEEEDQYYDEFGNPAVDPDDPFGKRKNNRYNSLDGRDAQSRNSAAGYR